MSAISIETLRGIAEREFEDIDEMATALREVANGLAWLLEKLSTQTPAEGAKSDEFKGRKAGRPIPEDCKVSTCRKCHADVVVFKSKRNGTPYLCDMEMGEYQKKRQFLTASNWFHNCGGGR